MVRSRKSGGTSVTNGDGQVDLDLLSAEPSVTTESISRGPSHWRPWAIGGIGALLVVWLAVALVSVATGGGASEATADESADIPTTVTAPGSAPDGEATPAPTPAPVPTPTTDRPTTTAAVEIMESPPIDPDSPHTLVVAASGRLRLLDLSTGRIEEYRVRGENMIATENHLVVVNYSYELDSNLSLTAIPVDDLAAQSGPNQPEPLVSIGWGGSALADEADHLWVVVEEDRVPATFQRIDLSTGTVVEERPVPGLPSLVTWGLQGTGSIDLLSSFAGGVYEYDGSGYRQVLPGRLQVAGDRLALVEHCDERFQCHQQWYDQSGWEPVERALPPPSFGNLLVGRRSVGPVRRPHPGMAGPGVRHRDRPVARSRARPAQHRVRGHTLQLRR